MKEMLLKDYKSPDYLIPEVELYINILDSEVVVKSKLTIEKVSKNIDASLVLDGKDLKIESLFIDDKPKTDYLYEDEKLIEVLYQYINSFVMCPNCNIPELLPSVDGKKKNKKLILTCSACGKSETKSHTCKEELKGIELILKHLENNVWTIKKGSMVEQIDTFDPFTHMLK